MIHHSPNEVGVGLEKKHVMALIAKWKSMGMRPGWPDLEAIAMQRDGTWRLFMVEVKSEDGVLSQAQKDIRQEFRAKGIPYCIARSIKDVVEFLEWEGIDMRAKQW